MSPADLEAQLRALAAPAEPGRLPDPDVVWQRAVIRERLRRCETATRPIRIAESASIVCAAGSVMALIAVCPEIETLFRVVNQPFVRLTGLAFGVVTLAGWLLIKKLADE